MSDAKPFSKRIAPARMEPDEFRALGHHLVDRIGDFLASLPERAAGPERSEERIQTMLEVPPLPEHGQDTRAVLDRAADLLFEHAMHTAHPRFWGYVLASGSPLGALGDLLAAAVNSTVSTYSSCPITVLFEAQTIRWIAELIGFSPDCGGLFLSGGSMANMVGIRAALCSRAGWDVRSQGISGPDGALLRVYTTKESHACVTKAIDVCGLGARAIRWIAMDDGGRMRPDDLREQIRADRAAGLKPFLVVATAGGTNHGVVDPLPVIAEICREQELWFHVDGAYGGFAAVSPSAPADIQGIREADSLAIDPHKWLYMPLEAGCVLTRDPGVLYKTFYQEAPYYARIDNPPPGSERYAYRNQGLQTSRGFRALKVWLSLQRAGRAGYAQMITDDIRLAGRLYQLVQEKPELQALTHNLSITTFRYVPPDLASNTEEHRPYLDALNRELMCRLQAGGVMYLSQASVRGVYALRACIVNYNTTDMDIEMVPALVAKLGAEVDADLRQRAAG